MTRDVGVSRRVGPVDGTLVEQAVETPRTPTLAPCQSLLPEPQASAPPPVFPWVPGRVWSPDSRWTQWTGSTRLPGSTSRGLGPESTGVRGFGTRDRVVCGAVVGEYRPRRGTGVSDRETLCSSLVPGVSYVLSTRTIESFWWLVFPSQRKTSMSFVGMWAPVSPVTGGFLFPSSPYPPDHPGFLRGPGSGLRVGW